MFRELRIRAVNRVYIRAGWFELKNSDLYTHIYIRTHDS